MMICPTASTSSSLAKPGQSVFGPFEDESVLELPQPDAFPPEPGNDVSASSTRAAPRPSPEQDIDESRPAHEEETGIYEKTEQIYRGLLQAVLDSPQDDLGKATNPAESTSKTQANSSTLDEQRAVPKDDRSSLLVWKEKLATAKLYLSRKPPRRPIERTDPDNDASDLRMPIVSPDVNSDSNARFEIESGHPVVQGEEQSEVDTGESNLAGNVYVLRKKPRELSRNAVTVPGLILDIDQSGTFDPSSRHEPETIANREPDRVREARKRTSDSEEDLSRPRKPRVVLSTHLQNRRQRGEQMHITLILKSEKGKGILQELRNRPDGHDNWPIWYLQDTDSDGAQPRSSNEPSSRRAPRPLNANDEARRELEGLHLGQPKARGCQECYLYPDGEEQCSLIGGGKYPCKRCQVEEIDCELILEPPLKKRCNNCAKKRALASTCDFIRNPNKRGACGSCLKSRLKCIAGPLKGKTRTGLPACQDGLPEPSDLESAIPDVENPRIWATKKKRKDIRPHVKGQARTEAQRPLLSCGTCRANDKGCSFEADPFSTNLARDCHQCRIGGLVCSKAFSKIQASANRGEEEQEEQDSLFIPLQSRQSSSIQPISGSLSTPLSSSVIPSNTSTAYRMPWEKLRAKPRKQPGGRGGMASPSLRYYQYKGQRSTNNRRGRNKRSSTARFSLLSPSVDTEILGGASSDESDCESSIASLSGDENSFYARFGAFATSGRSQRPQRASAISDTPRQRIKTRLAYPVQLYVDKEDCSWCTTLTFGWWGEDSEAAREVVVSMRRDGSWHEIWSMNKAPTRTRMCRSCADFRARIARCENCHDMQGLQEGLLASRGDLLQIMTASADEIYPKEIPCLCCVCKNAATYKCGDPQNVKCELALCNRCTKGLRINGGDLEGFINSQLSADEEYRELRADIRMFEHVRRLMNIRPQGC